MTESKKMAESAAQRKSALKYRKEKTKQVCLSFYPTDMELYDFLCQQENKTSYLKNLIRREMNSCQSVPNGMSQDEPNEAEEAE